ncbi:MAG: alanine--tRNA ligase [Candidatus Cloacimonetes bacterium]|nr:alanine--tRNA ligase [Candidatus Cloacimonadota bacterium]
MIRSKDIRKQFISFFESRGHREVASASLIPLSDPTLLFTNAGMNQFKDIFLGFRKEEYSRVVNSQKCIRAGGKHNDLEEVGRDGYHHTFFEMLGNWSFGDYYKKEAIIWAWELLTGVWGFPREKLYATVHDTDREAFELWQKHTNIDPSHIEFHGDKDNFWEMATTGPCGPCSEIHYDMGLQSCNRRGEKGHKCKINGDCHRFIEVWNLVFIQYNRQEDGSLKTLARKYVDTGAGFERICQILQKVQTNYETDLFLPLLEEISNLSGIVYPGLKDEMQTPLAAAQYDGMSHRVIADHIRALTFAIADGGMPANEGRGYVLRRILRRAARHGRLLDLHKPFLYSLVEVVIDIMGDHYQELREKQAHVQLVIKSEEERFNLTLDYGISKFEEIAAKSDRMIPGKDAFLLYDTFGFPLDLTRVMAGEKGLAVDEAGFRKEMEKQKQRARDAARFTMSWENIDWIELKPSRTTEFVGYHQPLVETLIQKYHIDDENNVGIVLEKTPFYAESGGQVADTGRIYNKECEVRITDVHKDNDIFVHIGKLVSGQINQEPVTAVIESELRHNIARNHTATHLLHKALRDVLGNHVQQKGSLVNPDYLRFDFTHYKQVNERELQMVERIVNRKVRECIPLETSVKPLEEARKEGAMALFGEKYSDKVRMVSIGDFSRELCGGTHLECTGEIGLFKITAESSIAAGVRRIEAITGERAEKYVELLENEIDEIARSINSPRRDMQEKINRILEENRRLHVQIKSVRIRSADNQLDKILKKVPEINGIRVVIARIKIDSQNEMRQLGDSLKEKIGSGIGVLAAEIEGKVALLAIVTRDLTDRYHAGKIVGNIAGIVGGSGGGRADMAMAGGKDVNRIDEALQAVLKIVRQNDQKSP